MNRTITLLSALLLFLSCGSAKQAETIVTEWNENDLKGNVKSVVTYYYSSKNDLMNTIIEQYNENNRLIEITIYSHNDSLPNRRILYNYNNGNITLERNISYRHNEKGDTSDIRYTYNDKGLNISIEEDRFGVIEKEYNEQDLLTRSIEYGDENTETRYTYDTNGKLTETHTLYDHVAYEYDNGGKLICCKTYENGSDLLLLTESYGYDDKGRRVRNILRDAETPSTLNDDETRRYDDKNRLVEIKSVDDNGATKRTVTFTYDKKDNMVEQKLYIAYSSTTELSTYTYDERGNWVEAQYNFGTTRTSAMREIEYYQ